MTIISYALMMSTEPPQAVPGFEGRALAAVADEFKQFCEMQGALPIRLLHGRHVQPRMGAIVAQNMHFANAIAGHTLSTPRSDLVWHAAAGGISLVEPLGALLARHAGRFRQAAAMQEELAALLGLLRELERRGLRFHLAPCNPQEDALEATLASRYGKYDEAVALFTRALDTGALEGYRAACTLTERADCWVELGRPELALADYDAALAADPDYYYAWYNRATLMLARRDLAQAIEDMDRAVASDPDSTDALCQRGSLRLLAQDTPGAMRDFEQALACDPDDEVGRYWRARACFIAGDYRAACADFEQALEIEPDTVYDPLWLYLARARLGVPDARQALEAHYLKYGQSHWPWPVFKLYLGRATQAACLDVAAPGAEQNEACFFIAMWHLLRDERGPALAALGAVGVAAADGLPEVLAARAELQRMGLFPLEYRK